MGGGFGSTGTRPEPVTGDEDQAARLEAELVHPMPREPDRLTELLDELIGLIAAECRRAGYLPSRKNIIKERKNHHERDRGN